MKNDIERGAAPTRHHNENVNNNSNVSTRAMLDGFFAQVKSVNFSIEHVQRQTEEIIGLSEKMEYAIGKYDEEEISQKLQFIMNDTNAECQKVKKLLQSLKDETKKQADKGEKLSEVRIRNNTVTTLTRQFVAVVQAYQLGQQEYKTKAKAKARRQVKLVAKDATDEEIEHAIENGGASSVIQAAILQDGDAISSFQQTVEDKYKDVLALERSVKQVHQMFMELALLVDQQGELVDSIEHQVNSAAEYVEQGNKQLDKAMYHRKQARKKYCCLMILFIGIMVAILVPSLMSN